MADALAPPATEGPSSQPSEPDQPTSETSQTDPASASVAPSFPQQQSSTPVAPISNPNPSPALVLPPPPPVASYAPPPISGATVSVPPSVPSFRPVPQFSPIPNYHNPGLPPPGVNSAPGSVPAPMMSYQVMPGQAMNPAMRPYAPMPNGFMATPQGTMTPAGLPRYPSPYPAMVRPAFPLRPLGAVGMLPGVARPPVPGIPGVRPIPPIVRPVVSSVTPVEKPQTTVYIGKIAPTVDNDFMLSLLRCCGPVKSWKRAQDPSDGTPRGFGFFEFESADGVLRALRLLSKFNIDGQELVLNVNKGTREYLERYVEKKTENAKKQKEGQAAEAGREGDGASGVEKNEVLKSSAEDLEENDAEIKDNNDTANFGIVTDEDREGDKDALKKLTDMIDERLKTNPLPPPPAQRPADISGHANPELATKLREGDSDVDITKNANDRNDDEITSDNKATSEHDKPETSSPERSRRYDRRSRERDRERDLKGDKEREIERYERDAERERARKEREQRRKIEEAEREYVERLKDWEYRERDREKQRHQEKEKEKERERKRKKEILYDEGDEDDDSRKRWRRSALEDKMRRRQREKEDDLADRLKEEEEIAEAKRSAEEEQQQLQLQRDALKLLSSHVMNGNGKKITVEEASPEGENKAIDQDYQDVGNLQHSGNGALQNGASDDSATVANAEPEMQQIGNAPARKLGFGIVGSGKRTAVPSVFHEEEDEDAHKDKKMRPLVPIDYSTEELQAVQHSVSEAQPVNLAAAAEFAKHISHVASKEEKPDAKKERSRHSHDRSGQRDRDRNDEDNSRTRDEKKEKSYDRERGREVKTPDTKKLLDAKQLIDMIPKTKEELFSYEINWAVYDKHELHERMRPWISKKITEFLGEEETTLVDYIVSSTEEHVKASQMLELLQSILDEEAEMFVLKMWRMLIFEIKKVETGLSVKSKG